MGELAKFYRPYGEPRLPDALGAYAVVAMLGRGGMADVYLAVPADPAQASRLYVLKLLRADLVHDPIARATFVAEGRLAARFGHPNLVSAIDVGTTDDGLPFLVLEYREGHDLRQIVRAARSSGVAVPDDLWAYVVASALAGLHHAHEIRDYSGVALGVLHRDVSPDNIVVGYEGHVALIDFGVARVSAHISQSAVGIMNGKIGYMAPEYIDDGEVDRRADVFSMGVVLWELLTGQKLSASGVGGGSSAPYFLSNKPIPRVSAVAMRVSPALDAIVAHALERDPRDRFPSARAMRESLEELALVRGRFRGEDAGQIVTGLFAETRVALRRAIERRIAEVRPRDATRR